MATSMTSSASRSIAAAAAIIAAASLVSDLLAVLRDRVLASSFGAGAALDMYYAAFRFPDLIYNFVILGALSAGFIPVFTQYLSDRRRSWALLSTVLNTAGICLIVCAALGAAVAPWIVGVLVPGFSAEQQATTTLLTRVMLFSPVLLGISGILGGALQSLRRFLMFSLAPIFYNVGIILGALVFVPWVGLVGLAGGVVLGAALHLALQLIAVYHAGYRHHWSLRHERGGMWKILRMMVPRTLALGVAQVNAVVMTTIGSSLAVGTVAVFNLANNLQSMPLGLFGVSIAVAAFPLLAESAPDPERFVGVLSHTLRQIVVFILPSAALLIVLRAQIVRAVLGAGQFSWEDTTLTLQALSIFAIGLIGQALVLVLARAFYALHNTKTPLVVAIIAETITIATAIILTMVFTLGVNGLAWAAAIGQTIQCVGLWLALWWKLGDVDGRRIVRAVSKLGIATAFLVLMSWATKFAVAPLIQTQTFWGIVIQGLAATVTGIGAYVGVGLLLRSEEISDAIHAVQYKVFRRQQAPVPAELVDLD